VEAPVKKLGLGQKTEDPFKAQLEAMMMGGN
jgi:hypothetical protein